MKFTVALSTLVLFFASSAFSAPADTVSVTYDPIYDDGAQSLNGVSCSNGANGLVTKGFTTFNSLPNFPNIGGVPAVEGWNSVNCGTCWTVTYPPTGKSINILAVDHSTGFNIALSAMNNITNGQAVQLGRVSATAVQVANSVCGL